MTTKSKSFIILLFNDFNLLIISAVGVPIKLLHESEGHVVVVELKNGETYRGLLKEAEDTMNCILTEGMLVYISSKKGSDNVLCILFISDSYG
jgi:small nuclear ribonucleoprotein (snRNP)-like protein